MHRTCWATIGIAAGGIVPDSPGAGSEPNVERIKEDAILIVRIHGDPLVVPVLGIIARAVLAVSKRAALRTLHEGPTRTAVSRRPGTDLAARRIAAAAIIVTNNGLCLCVDVIRVTRRDSNLHPAQLIPAGDVNKR